MDGIQVSLWVVVLLVALALLFDFMNGFHDAANSIATVVSTGVLKPTQAVVFAAFVFAFLFHYGVDNPIQKRIRAWLKKRGHARVEIKEPVISLEG